MSSELDTLKYLVYTGNTTIQQSYKNLSTGQYNLTLNLTSQKQYSGSHLFFPYLICPNIKMNVLWHGWNKVYPRYAEVKSVPWNLQHFNNATR